MNRYIDFDGDNYFIIVIYLGNVILLLDHVLILFSMFSMPVAFSFRMSKTSAGNIKLNIQRFPDSNLYSLKIIA